MRPKLFRPSAIYDLAQRTSFGLCSVARLNVIDMNSTTARVAVVGGVGVGALILIGFYFYFRNRRTGGNSGNTVADEPQDLRAQLLFNQVQLRIHSGSEENRRACMQLDTHKKGKY